MRRKIILHIGAAKTGSSTIQAFLRANRDYLSDQGYVIPDRNLGFSPKVTGEHVFATQSLITDPDKSRIKRAFEGLRSDPEEGKTVLISAENLSNPDVHLYFQDVLQEFEARVIIYIRRQDDLLTSSWQQWYSKVNHDFFAYIIREMPRIGHWDKIIQGWETAVGEGHVTVRLFDRAEMVEGDLLRDFSHAIGLDPKSDDPEYNIGNENPSFSDIITPLVAGNRHLFSGGHDNDFYNLVKDLTGDAYVEKRKTSLLSKAQRESVISFYEPINQRVCEKYFPGRPRLFEPVQHQNYQYLDEAEFTRRQLQFLTHMIFKLGVRGTGK